MLEYGSILVNGRKMYPSNLPPHEMKLDKQYFRDFERVWFGKKRFWTSLIKVMLKHRPPKPRKYK